MAAPRTVEVVVNTDDTGNQQESPNTDHIPIPIPIRTKSEPRNRSVDHAVLGTKSDKPRPPSWMAKLQREIDQVKAAVRTEPHGSDLRMLLFAAAASNKRYESTLVPLPPQFRTTTGSGCQVERLCRAIANNWPSCRVIPKIFNNAEELADLVPDDIDALRLLHWLLMPHPTYPSLRRLSILHLRLLCRILGLASPTQEPRLLISIGYDGSGPPERKWLEQGQSQGEKAFRRNYAFLGLALSQVYRFLYTGHLDIPTGEPIRLYSQLESALIHCLEPKSPPGQEQPPEQPEQQSEVKYSPGHLCWSKDRREQRALIICQLPAELDEPTATSPDQHFLEFIVKESTSLKPCYLLMYDEPMAAKMLLSWPGNPVEVWPPARRSVMQLYPRKLIGMAQYFGGRLGAFKRLISQL